MNLITKKLKSIENQEIDFIIAFLIGFFSFQIAFYNLTIIYNSLWNLVLLSLVTAILISFQTTFITFFPYISKRIEKGSFPQYGHFFLKSYWTGTSIKRVLGFFVLILFWFFLFLIIKFIIPTNFQTNDNKFLVIFEIYFLPSLILNSVLYFILLDNGNLDNSNEFSKYLKDNKGTLINEFDSIKKELKANPNLELEQALKIEMYKKSLSNRLFQHQFSNDDLYKKLYEVFVGFAPKYESISDKTYKLLVKLLNSDSKNTSEWIALLTEKRNELISLNTLDPNNWTMLEVLESFLGNKF